MMFRNYITEGDKDREIANLCDQLAALLDKLDEAMKGE
jgi:hypothetical protein